MKRLLAILGPAAIGAGIVLLAFAWCETRHQAETQTQLRHQLTTTTTAAPVTTLPPVTLGPATSITRPTTTQPPPPETLNLGQPLGTIQIPAIAVDQVVVYGIGDTELKGGPGLYPYTPAPWEGGNTAIAGHRTTNGAPFGDLDLLEPGDTISFDTINGLFTYEVTETVIVDDQDMTIVQDHGDDRITLTACHPKGSARQRIAVTAKLNPQPKETL